MEKLTDRSQGFLQSAQSLALRNNNQFITPAHLLKVMLDDKNGVASNLLSQAGANPDLLREEVAEELNKLPSEKVREIVGERLVKIEEGERDFRF